MPGFSWRFLEPATPYFIAALVFLAVLALRLYRRTEPPLETRLRTLLFALRAASIALLALLLLDPVLARWRERRVPPRVPVLLDASLSMALPFPDSTASASGAAPTRADRLADALDGRGARILRDLERGARVETFRFGDGITRLAWENPREEIAPIEDRTNLSRALDDAVGDDARTTGAILLFSDGAHNVGADPRETARRLGVPVFAVGVGSAGAVSDVSVFEIEASTVAYVDNRVPVVAKLRARGDPVPGAKVYLREGNAVRASARVDLPGGGVEREVTMHYTPKREGLRRYRVQTPAVPGEISEENNEQLIAVRVLEEKMRVLLVAGRPSFELTFLKRALESDVSLEVTPVILSLEHLPGRLGAGGDGFPESYAPLAEFDLVVLLDVAGRGLSSSRAAMIARYVEERGGALFLVGGAPSFELEGGPLADLAPLRTSSPARSTTGTIAAGLTDVGRAHPVTRLDADPAANARIWESLPPLDEVPQRPALGAGARVLVEGTSGRGEPLPLLVTREGRRGRVLAWAGGPYWRWELYPWGQGRSGEPYRRLVSRSVRWLVSRDELKQVSIRPSQTIFDGAEPPSFQGQVLDDDYRPVAGADVRVTVKGPLGTPEETTRELSLVDLGEGRFEGRAPGLPPGDYVVDGRAAKGEALLGEDRSEMTVTPYRRELEDPAPDFEILREIARQSGGAFLPLGEIDRLPGAMKLESVAERSVRETPLRENPWAFAALLGFLGTEWAMRKRRGLP